MQKMAGDAIFENQPLHSDECIMRELVNDPYHLSDIMEMIRDFDDLCTRPFTAADSVYIARKYRKRVEKLRLYLHDSVGSSIRHMLGTCLVAQTLMLEGEKVLLIESTDRHGRRRFKDIDLMTYNPETDHYSLYDYTQTRGKASFHLDGYSEKYEVLEQKVNANLNVSFHVCSVPLPERAWNITVENAPRLTRGHFVKEFEVIDSMINVSMDLGSDDIKMLLEDFTNKIERHVGQGHEKLVRTLPVGKRAQDLDKKKVVSAISKNSEASAAWFKREFMPLYDTHPSQELYSLDLFKRIEECEEKPLIKTPSAFRVPNVNDNCPFTRMSMIIKSMTNKGMLCHPLMQLIAVSVDGQVHPTDDELKMLSRNPHWRQYEGIKVVRAKSKDGEPLDAVRVRFSGFHQNLESLAYGNMETEHVVREFRSKKRVSSYEDLERQYSEISVWGNMSRQPSRYYQEISNLIDDSLDKSEFSQVTKKNMRKLLQLISETALGDQIAFDQEMAVAMSNARRKKMKVTSKHDNIFSKTCTLSLDCVADRLAVVVTNMSALLNTNVDQTFCVMADFMPECPYLSRSHTQGMSEWNNMSAADLDWKITYVHKLLSWLSLEYESVLLNDDNHSIQKLKTHLIYPALIMLINDQKFAQASEMVRYIFINSTGIAGGTKNLYDKISWYTPDSLVSKLYLLRMIKMSSLVQWMKGMNLKSDLLVKYKSFSRNVNENIEFNFVHWDIAFPHEPYCAPSDLSVYNNFYICKAFTVERHNRIMNEAQVLMKQLESRSLFLHEYNDHKEHDLRNIPNFKTKYELMTFLASWSYDTGAKEFSPDPFTVLLSSLSSLLHTHKSFDSLREVLNNYRVEDLPRSVLVTETMNNHGSVKSMGPNGVCVTKVEHINETGKTVFHNQNDRNYVNILNDVLDASRDAPPKPVPDDWNSLPVPPNEEKYVMTQRDLSETLSMPNVIWPYVQRHVVNQTQFVSKMTHKDQIGVREIATLNAASRICCYYVEEISRYIRDREQALGNKVNMIERKDKEAYVKGLFNTSRIQKAEGKMIIYDSADCSKWGPSMLVYILYLVQGLRIRDESLRSLSRACLQLFGNKVFKIPDAYFTNLSSINESQDVTNVVLKAAEQLRNMSAEMGDLSKQIIYLPDSMHQGILGVTSSVLAADAQHLSKYVTEFIQKDVNLKIQPVVTSDDYSRIISLDSVDDDEHTLTKVVKKCLSIHNHISLNCGIKRNMEKSTHSTSVLEFNSIFYTANGENRPDIKSRLSYVGVHESYDPYPSALACMNKGAEFLRNESSFYGACWVQLLNTHLSMLQHQNLPLYRSIGEGIFMVPLELGGYPKIDPMLAVVSAKYTPLFYNYSPSFKPDARKAIQMMFELRPSEIAEVSLDPEDEMKSVVPKMSRSGVVHLCRRDKKTTRKVREFLDMLTDADYCELRYPGSNKSFIPALLACMQREESLGSEESPSARFSIPQTPRHLPLYRLNSPALSSLLNGKTMVSRHELHAAAVLFYDLKATNSLEDTEWFKNFLDVDVPLFYQNLDVDLSNFVKERQEIRLVGFTPMSKKTHKMPIRDTYVPSLWYETAIQTFISRFCPVSLGGHTDIKPRLYLESVMMYRAKIKDLIQRKQSINLVLLEGDDNIKSLQEKIILGSYMLGCRAVFNREAISRSFRVVEDDIMPFLRGLSRPDWTSKFTQRGDDFFDILSDNTSAAMKLGLISSFDIGRLLESNFNTSEVMSFSSTRTKLEVWHALFKAQSVLKRPMFAIKPSEISLSRKSDVFKMSSSMAIYSNPIEVRPGEVCGTEIIYERSGWYKHYITIFDDVAFTPPKDTNVDKYCVLNVSSLDKMKVKISDQSGFLMLCTLRGHPISILCSGIPVNKELTYVHFSRTFLTQQIVDTLDLENPNFGMDSHLLKILAAKMDLYAQENIDTIKTREPQPEEEFEQEEADFAAMGLIDDGLDFSSFLDFEGIPEDDVIDNAESRQRQVNELDDDEDPFDWGEEPYVDPADKHVWEDLETQTSYISSHGVFRPTSTLLATYAFGNISTTPGSIRRHLKHAIRQEKTYTLVLPFKCNQEDYASGPTGTGLTELLAELMNRDDADSSWCVSYLRDMILNDNLIMTDYINWSKNRDDEDW